MQKGFYYSDKPNIDQIQQISQENLEKKIGFRYSNTVEFSTTLQKSQQFIKLPSRDSEEKRYKNLRNIEQHLAICLIDSSVGHGIFAMTDIEENTCLGSYAGKILRGQKDDGYKFTVGLSYEDVPTAESIVAEFKKKTANCKQKDIVKFVEQEKEKIHKNLQKCAPDFNSLDSFFVVSAKEQGNLSRFFQHLPPKNKAPHESIASANLTFINVFDTTLNLPVIIFITSRNISKGEQLGYDYGDEYWHVQGRNIKYFSLTGKVISENSLRKINMNESILQQIRKNSESNEVNAIARRYGLFDYSTLCNITVTDKQNQGDLSPLLEYVRSAQI